ncbi:MAG TPA: sugar ABC transporter substrate-binding protein [Anaerolineae bacterium]|nr:sugar ABC transporter substrate-binding protein [Anaerolineae bacterium]HNU05578.1 sugar ABC transporter substrate-binding protein [Anaerolineae bacterium]
MYRRFLLIVSLLVIFSLVLGACGGAATPAPQAPAAEAPAAEAPAAQEPAAAAPPADAGSATLEYWLWDTAQLPPYQACADAFTAANPNIKVNITQKGWDDYWSGIQNGMIAGNAPDMFTNHLAKYPEFASKGQLVDIQPYIARDGVDMSVYLKGLADLWGRDGKQYGLPKDWDTVAIVYNKDMLDAAGVTVEELNAATWNPEDGGSFTELMAKLTLDANGKNALDPAFDKSKVAQYGFIPEGADNAYGQTGWSWLAYTTGWTHVDGLWATEYHYDDPRMAATMQWFADSMKAGTMMPLELVSGLGGAAAFTGGKGALISQGSWMIGFFAQNTPFSFGFARLPEGPEGRRSMFNGLADSIWTGSKNPEAAWQFLKFLASAECANIVGDAGVVFPAQQSGVDRAIAAYEAKNLDVSAFTTQATEPDGTFLFPVTDHSSEIEALVKPVMQSILLGQVKAADVLPPVNAEVNALFQ